MTSPVELPAAAPRAGVAVLMVAATYLYFLLFAEFALLAHAQAALGASPAGLRPLLLALGGGGIIGSVMAGWMHRADARGRRLAAGFAAAAVAATAVRLTTGAAGLTTAAGGVGLALGYLTVTLAANLRDWVGADRLGRVVGLGTGLAYGCSNVPAVFQARAANQILFAAGAVLIAALLALTGRREARAPAATAGPPAPRVWLGWILVFLGLVWLDSAAFYVIQHTPPLRSLTWDRAGRLWSNAALHLAAGVSAGFALDRGHLRRVLVAGLVALVLGCAALAATSTTAGMVSLLYPIGVSLYSAALVYVPARSGSPRQIAALYAISGWLGSALGIGLAQDLQHVPLAFVLGAGALVLPVLLSVRRPGAAAVVGLGLLAWTGAPAGARAGGPGEETWIARGREVYLAEGCLHCHSQFVRPGTIDVARWGPASSVAEVVLAQPPLPGNRRQGPDLSHVGERRTPEWNRLHLMAPRAISPGSRMPSYAHVFRDGDGPQPSPGEALVAYLNSLRPAPAAAPPEVPSGMEVASGAADVPSVQFGEARELYVTWCASCHGPRGHGDGALARRLSVPPPDFTRDPWRRVPPGANPDAVLAHIIANGLPGTPMAGHEYFTPAELRGLAQFVRGLHAAGHSDENPGGGR